MIRGDGAILAPPRVATPFVGRAGDARSPSAISQALYHRDPRIADIVFEGGDLAATPHWVFADINLANRNLGRTEADPMSIQRELHRRLGQELIWLGDTVGDVPRHPHRDAMYAWSRSMAKHDDRRRRCARGCRAAREHEPAGIGLPLEGRAPCPADSTAGGRCGSVDDLDVEARPLRSRGRAPRGPRRGFKDRACPGGRARPARART